MYYNKKDLIDTRVNRQDTVLGVGFLGQGIKKGSLHWPHILLQQNAKEVYGLDVELDEEFKNNSLYREASAEDFSFPVKFDVIFAGDLIEHLSNPGLFLECCKKHLKQNGRLILTTPNTFNLFNIAEKLTKREPTINEDHTLYFNDKTLLRLLVKNGMSACEVN